MAREFLLIFALIFWGTLPSESQCRRVTKNEAPHQGNDFNELTQKIAPILQGKVMLAGHPAAEVIIEVFKYPSQFKNVSHSQIPLTQKRVKACKTDKDGRFEMKSVKAGKYFLRVGYIDKLEINPTHVVFIINKKAESITGEGLEIPLWLAH